MPDHMRGLWYFAAALAYPTAVLLAERRYGMTGLLVAMAACAVIHFGVIERVERRRRRARREAVATTHSARAGVRSPSMTTFTQFAAGSFAKTPVSEVSAKAQEISALGWEEREDGRGDPWAVAYRKDFPEDEGADYEAELREVMGAYWVTAEEIRALLGK